MKTLGKLNINSLKIIKPEELVLLKGGGACYCINCSSYGRYLGAGSYSECLTACWEINCNFYWDWWG